MRNQGPGIAGNPVLVGAATVLVVLVAMVLAYNANQGLPFVPTYELEAEVPSAANLVRGNDVRIGGARVGTITRISARRREDGSSVAVLDLRLDQAVAPLPRDSTTLVRPRSVLGLKYLEITRGRSRDGYEPGDTIPVTAARPEPVELDEVTDVFDARTRAAQADVLHGMGDGLAARGPSINQAIGALRPLLRDLEPVARNLRDPDTGLERLIGSLAGVADELAPAAEAQARLFVDMERTFGALREVAPEMQDAIVEAPPTLDAAVESFRIQRPFLANATGLMRELRPGVAALRRAAPPLSAALEAGVPTLGRSVLLSRRLGGVMRSLRAFSQDPLAARGIEGLGEGVRQLDPTLQFLAPAQTTCNYVSLWFRNIASHLSEGDATGTWQRFIVIPTPKGPNNEGGPSTGPASGPSRENYLHANPYPHTAAPGQPRECEAGNEPYLAGQLVTSNVPGNQPASTEGDP